MNTFTKLLSIGLFGAALLTSAHAHAGATCEVVVTNLDVAGSGLIYLTGTGVSVDGGTAANFQHVVLCSVSGPAGSYTADACKELHKDLAAALLSGKKVTLWMGGASGTCTPGGWENLSAPAFNLYHASLKK